MLLAQPSIMLMLSQLPLLLQSLLVRITAADSVATSAEAPGANFCTANDMACGARLLVYESGLEPTDSIPVEEEGSGWGWSAMKDMPLYDEFFEAPTAQLGAFQSQSFHRICDCPTNYSLCPLPSDDTDWSTGNEQSSSGSSNSDQQLLQLDSSITLAFCGNFEQLVPHICRGARSIIRVIGKIQSDGQSLSSIVETLIFCRCPNGYQRIRIEPWLDHLYALIYRCSTV